MAHSKKIDELTQTFSFHLRLARATELAQVGGFLHAEELLMRGLELPETQEELDLLARIYFHQKKYHEARARWLDALRVSSGKNKYQTCIDSLDQYIISLRRHNLRIGLIACVLFILLALLGYLISTHWMTKHDKIQQIPPSDLVTRRT